MPGTAQVRCGGEKQAKDPFVAHPIQQFLPRQQQLLQMAKWPVLLLVPVECCETSLVLHWHKAATVQAKGCWDSDMIIRVITWDQ